MIGKTISHYKILEKLGEGGMGVVYKAEDTKLKRTVALKFLTPQAVGTEDDKTRFIHEAQAAAALNHNNICTIYEIDEFEGQSFIAMECVEGKSIKDMIRSGPLDLGAALDIAIQAGEGLGEAHERGVIHRDIKSANVMVTGRGQAKIMDFGLAMSPGRTQITRTGTTVGTVAYMSPEQACGDKVDQRSDMWSLGVVLFEMIAGQLPFQGDHEQAVVYSIVNKEAKPIADLCSGVPVELQKIFKKCLAKDPNERYQSADELAADLDRVGKSIGDAGGLSLSASRKTGAKRARRRWMLPAAAIIVLVLAGFVYVTQFRYSPDQGATAIETSAEKAAATVQFDRSIVVLPFEDISPSGDNEYFSDGLTDEIIADLSRVRSLRVISRTSAMALKGTDMDIKAIGERLDVRYVLEGSVRKAGDELKITAQLIDATVDAHVWTGKYDGTLDDVFDMQEQVSRSIVDALEVELNPDEDREIAERPLDNVRAYELYLRARLEISHMSEESIDNALEDLERGLEIVGENEMIYAAIGYAYYQYVNIGASILGEYEGEIEECAEKIFELEPESVHGYMLLARLEIMRGNTRREVEYLKKVLERDPQNSDALSWLAFAYAAHAKMDAAWRIFRTIERNDPLRPRLRVSEVFLNWVDGRFDMALEIVEQMYDSGIPRTLEKMFYATMLIYNRRPDDASRVTADLERDAPEDYLTLLTRSLIDAHEGRKADVERTMTPDFVAATEQDFQYSMMTAGGYSLLGENEKALYWLENAIKRGFNNYIYMSEHDPFLATLRGEDRFEELMKHAKARCDEFEVLE